MEHRVEMHIVRLSSEHPLQPLPPYPLTLPSTLSSIYILPPPFNHPNLLPHRPPTTPTLHTPLRRHPELLLLHRPYIPQYQHPTQKVSTSFPTKYRTCTYTLPTKCIQILTVTRTLPSGPSSMKPSGRKCPRSLKIRGLLCIELLAIASVECRRVI